LFYIRDETRSFALNKGYRLKRSKKRVFKKILGPKREEVKGGWRKLHNEELHDLYSLPNIIRVVNKGEGDLQGMWHALGRRETYIGLGWGNMKEGDYLKT